MSAPALEVKEQREGLELLGSKRSCSRTVYKPVSSWLIYLKIGENGKNGRGSKGEWKEYEFIFSSSPIHFLFFFSVFPCFCANELAHRLNTINGMTLRSGKRLQNEGIGQSRGFGEIRNF